MSESATLFADEIIRLGVAFGAKVDSTVVSSFRTTLANVTVDQLSAAVETWMRDGKRMPRPIELRRIIESANSKPARAVSSARVAGYVCNACGVVVACAAIESHAVSCEWNQRRVLNYSPVDPYEVYLRGLVAICATRERNDALAAYRASRRPENAQ